MKTQEPMLADEERLLLQLENAWLRAERDRYRRMYEELRLALVPAQRKEWVGIREERT